MNRMGWVVTALVVFGCGRTDMEPAFAAQLETSASQDGGLVRDAGAVDSGSADGGAFDAGLWCGLDRAACLANGSAYGVQGRCCNGRHTCKGRQADGGGVGYCEY